MNKIYKTFLKNAYIPNEEEFVKTLNSLPKFDELSTDESYDGQYDNLEDYLFNWGVLCSYPNVAAECVNIVDKTVELNGLGTLEELKEIADKLSVDNWTIINYNELEHCLEDEEVEDYISSIKNLSVETLKEIVDKYVDK